MNNLQTLKGIFQVVRASQVGFRLFIEISNSPTVVSHEWSPPKVYEVFMN